MIRGQTIAALAVALAAALACGSDEAPPPVEATTAREVPRLLVFRDVLSRCEIADVDPVGGHDRLLGALDGPCPRDLDARWDGERLAWAGGGRTGTIDGGAAAEIVPPPLGAPATLGWDAEGRLLCVTRDGAGAARTWAREGDAWQLFEPAAPLPPAASAAPTRRPDPGEQSALVAFRAATVEGEGWGVFEVGPGHLAVWRKDGATSLPVACGVHGRWMTLPIDLSEAPADTVRVHVWGDWALIGDARGASPHLVDVRACEVRWELSAGGWAAPWPPAGSSEGTP